MEGSGVTLESGDLFRLKIANRTIANRKSIMGGENVCFAICNQAICNGIPRRLGLWHEFAIIGEPTHRQPRDFPVEAKRPMRTDHHPDHPHSMRCMEIRGGSRAVEETFDAPGLDEWVFSQPYEAAQGGGDVHYFSLCGGGIVSRLILADISGHGAAVAEVAEGLRKLMKKNINVKNQARLVRDLNRQFATVAQTEHFATAVIATYLATDRTLTICNAGHPRPLYRRAADGRWEFLGPTEGEVGNLPWGLDDETPYHQFQQTLGVGDIVLFYTDALVEAADPSGRQLGEEGLLALASGLDHQDDVHVGHSLVEAVANHRGGHEADDDVTLVAWRHNASGPRHPSLAEKVDTYAKVFGLRDF